MRRTALAFVVACTVLAAPACGGSDAFPKDEFVKQVTAGGVTRPIAVCTYDNIKSDQTIMDDLKRAGGPNDNVTSKTADRLAHVIATCLVGTDATTTTTTKKR